MAARWIPGAALMAACASVALAWSPAALAAPPPERTILYGASGLLLEPLPQLAPGDLVRVVVVPDGDFAGFDDAVFTLRFGCGGRGDELPHTLELPRAPHASEAALPADCTAQPGEIRWDLEAAPATSLQAQRALHGAIRAYQTIEATADRALGGAAPSDPERDALRAAVAEVNQRARDLDGAPPEVRAAFERVLQPVAFEGELTAGDVPREEWLALREAAREAFAPYHDLSSALSAASRQARERRRALAADLASVEIEQRWYDDHLADVSAEELEAYRDKSRALTVEVEALRSERQRLEWQLSDLDDQRAIAVLPVRWLATGATRVGARDRVLTIDPEQGRFEQTQLPVDDRDRVWVAVANTGADWAVTGVELTQVEGPEGGIDPAEHRGAAESEPIPDLALRDDAPRYRTVLRDLGVRDGNQEVAITLSAADGEGEATVGYRVRRTYHLAVHSGFAMTYQPDQELSYVTDDAGGMLYRDGVPVVASTGKDYQPAVLIALAAYPYATDLLDGARRDPWTRVVPHAVLGWSPTQLDRGYLGLGLEPVTGISLSGGATGGASQVLVRDPSSYGWDIQSRFSIGWYAAVMTDVTLFRHIFQGF